MLHVDIHVQYLNMCTTFVSCACTCMFMSTCMHAHNHNIYKHVQYSSYYSHYMYIHVQCTVCVTLFMCGSRAFGYRFTNFSNTQIASFLSSQLSHFSLSTKRCGSGGFSPPCAFCDARRAFLGFESTSSTAVLPTTVPRT